MIDLLISCLLLQPLLNSRHTPLLRGPWSRGLRGTHGSFCLLWGLRDKEKSEWGSHFKLCPVKHLFKSMLGWTCLVSQRLFTSSNVVSHVSVMQVSQDRRVLWHLDFLYTLSNVGQNMSLKRCLPPVSLSFSIYQSMTATIASCLT